MNYSEASYFGHNACQHVVAWLENRRLADIKNRLASIDARNRRYR